MNTQKFLLGTLAGAVSALIIGYLVWGMLLAGFMADHSTASMREQPDWLWMVIGHIFWGALIAYIWLKWANIRTFMGGVQGGFIIGLLIALAWNCIGYGISPVFDLTYVVVDSIASAIVTALVGGIVGMVVGMGGGE